MYKLLIVTNLLLLLGNVAMGQMLVKNTGRNTLIKVTSDGKMGVGIGDADPTEILEINGGIRLIPSNGHDPTDEGTLYYDTEDDSIYISLNGAWRAFRGPQGPEGPQGPPGPGWPTNSAKIYRTTDLTISASSAYSMHKIPMNATDWNNGGLYNSTQDCFRIPAEETGYYLVTATVAASDINTGEFFCTYIIKSSSPGNLENSSYIAGQGTTTYNHGDSGTATASHVSASFIANAGDYVAIAVNSSNTDGYKIDNVVLKAHNCATIVFLGPS